MTTNTPPAGSHYALGQTYWPPADEPASRYNCRYGHHELVVYHHPIDAHLIEAFSSRPIRFAHWKDDPVMWILYRLDGYEWADAPFTIHNVEPEGRLNPPLVEPNNRYLLTLLLVDCPTSRIAGIRLATIPPESSAAINRTIGEQLDSPFSPNRFNQQVDRAYRTYPTARAMVEQATPVETLGA